MLFLRLKIIFLTQIIKLLGVKKTLLPINSIIRIDEVTELGKSKISKTDVANVAPLSIDFSKKK